LWIFRAIQKKNCHKFLNHIERVTGVETWVSFMGVKTKVKAKALDSHTLSKQAEKV
jgi:hypothetical protein